VNYYLESLGCPKNLVDAQGMARLLKHLGHTPVDDPRRAKVLLVNTCGFIEDANQVLIATGCLSQYWGDRLLEAVPGLDGLLGTRRWHEIEALVEAVLGGSRRSRGAPTWLDDPVSALDAGQHFARQGASAYLKIAEGCSAPCAFCAIPLIKGPARSRPAEAIVQDAVELVQQGVLEINLIAQDTSAYGRDRGERDALPGLVQAILQATPRPESIEGHPEPVEGHLELVEGHPEPVEGWLRLMYAYPGHVSPRLIELMASDPRICHYLDLPLQHAHPATLRRMKRPADVDRTRQLIADLRAALPDLALRTSFIVGYPGETEAEFQALLDFVADVRFDRVGVFFYSPEEGTTAASLPDWVPEAVQVERYDRLMELQQGISLEINQAQVGRTLEVLIEGQGDGLSVGRSYRDAPEIDGLVLVPGDLPVGKIAPVRITGAMEYDLVGEPVT
jgi:ribosomal protein S12 methylthiotransferase